MVRRKKADEQLDDLSQKNPISDPEASPEKEIEAHREEEEEVRIETASEEDDPLAALQRSYDDLKGKFDQSETAIAEAKRQAEAAAREAEQHRRRADEASTNLRQFSVAAIDQAIAQMKTNITSLKAESERAAVSGEWAIFSEANEALIENKVHLRALMTSKEQGGQEQPRLSSTDTDRADRFIETLTPRSQEWVRKHKEDIFSGERRQSKAQAAHFDAVANGYEADTAPYFEHLDKYMGYGAQAAPVRKDPEPVTETAVQRERERGAVASAPPARINPTPQRNNQVRLTKEQRETALQMYPDKKPEDAISFYAEQVRQLNTGKTHLLMSTDKYRGYN